MQVPIYDINGSEKGTIELDDRVFNIKPNKSCIYYVLRAELRNLRVGTASTKTRAEVRGGGAKPWRQKGTGRARAGSRRSPIWVGGGIVFGPKPRSYKVKVPKKMKRLSLRSVLSLKAQNQQLKVVEDFRVESGKTRDFFRIATSLIEEEARKRVIFINGDTDELTKRAGRNIPWIKIFNANLLNTKDLFYADKLLLTESAVKLLNEKYSSE
ncbi:MAG: 50S ribosomal protein L4 [Spirochaetes bacterium]|nr:MAG: 50S ribosomal protein L4 [Spirochaetota bacterium]